jgi:hypothetical protein
MTEYMLNIAQKLQRDPEFKTDQLIYPLAQLQTLLAEVRDLYRVEKSPNGRLRLHTHADRLIKHLDLWYSSLSLDFRGLGTISAQTYRCRGTDVEP